MGFLPAALHFHCFLRGFGTLFKEDDALALGRERGRVSAFNVDDRLLGKQSKLSRTLILPICVCCSLPL